MSRRPPDAPNRRRLVIAAIVLGALGLYGAYVAYSWRAKRIATAQAARAARLAARAQRARQGAGGAIANGRPAVPFVKHPAAPLAKLRDVPPPRLSGGLRLPVPVFSDQQMVLEVVNDLNQPVEGANVSVKPDTGCGKVVVDSALTDATGHIGAVWTLGHRAGVCSAVVRVVGSEKFPGIITVVTTNGPPWTIEVDRGGNQSARYGDLLPDFIEVTVHDKYGNVARNARIRFEIAEGGGRLVDYAAVPALVRNTGLKGNARVVWRLGPAGTQKLRVHPLDSPGAPDLYISAGAHP